MPTAAACVVIPTRLVAVIPELRDVADVTAVTFRQQPSGDLTFADLIELARAIEQSFDEGVDGVVVTQGTDTLEETAFALDDLPAVRRQLVCHWRRDADGRLVCSWEPDIAPIPHR